MERTFPKRELLLIVITLPGSTESAKAALEDYSGYFASRFVRYVRMVIDRPTYIKVWEYQKRGALHLNVFLHVPRSLEDAFTTEAIKLECACIFRDIGARTGVDMFERAEGGTWAHNDTSWRIDCTPLRTSLCDYLAKKHTKEARTRPDGTLVSPARWYDRSESLRALVKRETTEATVSFHSESEPTTVETSLIEMLAVEGSIREVFNPITGKRVGVTFKCRNINTTREIVRELSEFANSKSDTSVA